MSLHEALVSGHGDFAPSMAPRWSRMWCFDCDDEVWANSDSECEFCGQPCFDLESMVECVCGATLPLDMIHTHEECER